MGMKRRWSWSLADGLIDFGVFIGGEAMIRRLVIFILAVAALGFAQGKHPFTFEDMMALKRVGAPVVSPNGKWVAFSAVEVNLQENTRTPHVWVVPIAGGEATQLTKGEGEDRPRWSPDGRQLAFVLRRGTPQIWAMDINPDTAMPGPGPLHQLTSISTGAEGELWSPDGKYILFTSQVYPDCNSSSGSPSRADVARDGVADDACNKKRNDEKALSKVKATIFRGLFYRHWSTYTGDKRTHICIQRVGPPLSLPGLERQGGDVPRDLTPGDHDAPPFSLGGQDMYAFSPDSQEVAFTSNIDEVPAASTNNEIFVVPVTGGTPKKISTSPGSDSTPLYSPDGKYIAWRMQETPGYESDRFQLVLYDRKSGRIRSLTKDFDRWVGSFVWATDSKFIYFTAENEGESPIYRIAAEEKALKSGNLWPLPRQGGHIGDLSITPDGKTLVFAQMSAQAPNEISTLWGGKCAVDHPIMPSQCAVAQTERLTHLNDAVLSHLSMQPLEPFWFTGAANQKVQGFLVKPPNFDATKKYPVKFLIHGGPEGAWGDSWTYRWNAQLFAAGGYVVVMINFTGSTGYGQKFTQAIQGDWGGRPHQDLMLGLDYVEKTYPFIDKDRECALGASFGGYMANWILGHTTRFKCIVSHDGDFNLESSYGSTEELWFPEWEFKGTPWTNREMYRKWSPHLFAQNFKTPTLVVHGQLDYRLDVSEGFQLFTTLQRLKVPSKMLYFPDEGHWVLKPQNSRLWYQTVNDWVDQWTSQK
jgi:dipeptidyl aminopeptidase/acylaminoacyl peptidase